MSVICDGRDSINTYLYKKEYKNFVQKYLIMCLVAFFLICRTFKHTYKAKFIYSTLLNLFS